MYNGMFWHVVAKVVFVVSSYLLHYFLGQWVEPAEYGIIGTLLTIINFDYLFFSNGARQTVSKTIAQNKYDVTNLIKMGILFQSAIVLVVFIVNFFGADLIANGLGDNSLSGYIRQVAWLIPFTGIYFLCLGILNGFRLFISEAIIAITYPLLKLSVLVFVGFHLFQPINGTIIGFLFAVALIALISMHQVYLNRSLYHKKGKKIAHMEFFKTTLSYSILFSVISAIMNSGTLILKALSGDNALVGYYTGCTTFGQVPYFLLTAIYLVILPIITQYYNNSDIRGANRTMKDIFLLVFMVLLPVATIISGLSKQILTSFYKEEYSIASSSLSILIWGTFFVGMTIIFNMIISSTNRKRFTTLMSVFILFAQIILCFVLTKYFSIDGTSMSLTIVSGLSMVLSYIYMTKIFGSIFDKKHYFIIIFNAAIFIMLKVISRIFNIHNLVFVIFLCGIIYIAQLAATILILRIRIQDLIKIVNKK